MNAVLTILIGSIFVNNFAMSRFYGICPFLGVSKKLETAFGMGMAVTFVMAVASLVAYLVNTFLLIPLIVVNCIIFGRAEAFAFKNKPLASAVDGLGMGLGFTLAITLISSIRELFGVGTVFGVQVMPEGYLPMDILVKPAGGFIVLGLTLALMNKLLPKKA